MNYNLCCLDLTQDGKTLVDTELTAVSDLWLAPAGNAAKAKQITAKEPAIGGFSWMPNRQHRLCQRRWGGWPVWGNSRCRRNLRRGSRVYAPSGVKP